MPFFHRTGRAVLSHESQSLLPSRRAGLALVLATAVVVSGLALAAPQSAQAATSYPSWSDLEKAAANESSKAAEVSKIQSLIAGLKADVVAKQKIAAQRGTDLQVAQQKFDTQESKANALQAKADNADRVAKASESRAGQLAAQLGRSGSDSLSSDLLADPGKASNLLYKLGAMQKLTEQAQGIYAEAVQDHNAASGLTDQAEVAAKALKDLQQKAADALTAANDAQVAAVAAVDAQKDNQDRLTAQLAAIRTDRALTEKQYNEGVIQKRKAEAEAARKAAAEALRISGATGIPNSQGWTRPAGGYITSGFGMRVDPYTGYRALHAGTDLGASCGSNIYAAHAGTVIYAGPYGGYGNFVLLDDGDNINTGYGHIVDGGIHVSVGQSVAAGAIIAQVGSTGWSTGCHLHFETRVGGVAQDAVPFMAARGVTLR